MAERSAVVAQRRGRAGMRLAHVLHRAALVQCDAVGGRTAAAEAGALPAARARGGKQVFGNTRGSGAWVA